MFCNKLFIQTYKLAITSSTSKHIILVQAMKYGFRAPLRRVSSLSPQRITELLTQNELQLTAESTPLPSHVKSVECNQLASNSPIEDRLRVSTIHLPDSDEPTLILGVFDGHGGGTTADLISRRLFNYIALSLHPEPDKLKISNQQEPLKDYLVNLHHAPQPRNDARVLEIEKDMLCAYQEELTPTKVKGFQGNSNPDIAAYLKASFQRCDDDLSKEILENLARPSNLTSHALRHYLEAAVSGCCAIVMVIHRGLAYLASTGDCRAVLGIHYTLDYIASQFAPNLSDGHSLDPRIRTFTAEELNDEHNCDNINEVRRLAASHPKSEQNTIIKHNRLLGNLMPFRAFGDFTYKWPSDVIRTSGIIRAFGPGVIPSNYQTPPYLITEPDVKVIRLDDSDSLNSPQGNRNVTQNDRSKYLVMASDGLWELFESSRDVIEAIVEHSMNASIEGNKQDYDTNCATYILRSALRNGPHQDISLDPEDLRRLYHIRLESTLLLPRTVVRNFRDDISIILLKLR